MNKKIPMRQCVGCGEMKNKREMMRVLKTPEGPIVLDATGRKNGRGAAWKRSLVRVKPNKVFSLLGLATRAGRTASGEFMTEKSVKNKTAALVIVGTDASANTKKNFRDMCSFYHVPYYEYGTKEELGHAMGKEMRASLAVTDAGFAKTLNRYLETEMKETEGNEWQK